MQVESIKELKALGKLALTKDSRGKYRFTFKRDEGITYICTSYGGFSIKEATNDILQRVNRDLPELLKLEADLFGDTNAS